MLATDAKRFYHVNLLPGRRTYNVMWHHVQPLVRAQGQLTLQQSIAAPRGLSLKERNDVKRAEVAFCVRGYHSINSVESDGLQKLLQTYVDIAAAKGRFEVRIGSQEGDGNDAGTLFGRKTVSHEIREVAAEA